MPAPAGGGRIGVPAATTEAEIAARAANWLLAATSALATLGAAELLLRAVDCVPDYWDWHRTLVELDPVLLYRLRGHSRPDLNSLGYRDREFPAPVPPGASAGPAPERVVLVGDSFLFGDNVEPDRTLPRQLARELGPGFEVYNLGIPGDGPDQSYQRLLADGLALDPRRVGLALYPANDFNDLEKNQLYLLDSAGKIHFNRDNPVAREMPLLRTPVLLRKLLTGRGLPPASEERLKPILGIDPTDLLRDPGDAGVQHKRALMDGVLGLFAATAAERGFRLFSLVIPSLENIQDDTRFREQAIPPGQYFNNETLALELCRRHGIPAIDLRGPFLAKRKLGLFQPGDGHLTPRGNRLAAQAVAAWLRDSGAGRAAATSSAVQDGEARGAEGSAPSTSRQ